MSTEPGEVQISYFLAHHGLTLPFFTVLPNELAQLTGALVTPALILIADDGSIIKVAQGPRHVTGAGLRDMLALWRNTGKPISLEIAS